MSCRTWFSKGYLKTIGTSSSLAECESCWVPYKATCQANLSMKTQNYSFSLSLSHFSPSMYVHVSKVYLRTMQAHTYIVAYKNSSTMLCSVLACNQHAKSLRVLKLRTHMSLIRRTVKNIKSNMLVCLGKTDRPAKSLMSSCECQYWGSSKPFDNWVAGLALVSDTRHLRETALCLDSTIWIHN